MWQKRVEVDSLIQTAALLCLVACVSLLPLKSPGLEVDHQQTLIGAWHFKEVIWRGNRIPHPKPDLRIEYEFYVDGSSRLRWNFEGEPGFCERFGQYRFDGRELVDKIVSVNSANRADCSRDPDMQPGRTASTPASVEPGNEFWLTINLADDDLKYVFSRRENEPMPSGGHGLSFKSVGRHAPKLLHQLKL